MLSQVKYGGRFYAFLSMMSTLNLKYFLCLYKFLQILT